MSLDARLLSKYDIPAPRYTSYPTVPYWDNSPTSDEWVESINETFSRASTSWAMYVHIPYCETLCTFCGCSVAITKDHSKENPYVDALIQEWRTYKAKVPALSTKPLHELHLGGGTPTFLSPQNLERFLSVILKETQSSGVDASIEVDPRRTTSEHLRVLRGLGFRRISLGVQDFDPEVQRLVHRVQSRELVAKMTEEARALGYTSVNYDLIYGLPKQTPETMRRLAESMGELRPDRIALYSYAKVPWIKPAQRLFSDEDLPEGAAKRNLYELAREIMEKAGYKEIGMDHFALPHDSLYQAMQTGKLHRNFMGYTHRRTDVLLGLGMTAISESPACFHQNDKDLNSYLKRVTAGEVPTLRGHKLTAEDRAVREQILKLMTQWKTELIESEVENVRLLLQPMFEDGLVTLKECNLSITENGRAFLRNACMALDQRLRRRAPATRIFSQAL